MSLWSRILNAFRSERLAQEIDEELESHIEEAIAHGRNSAEVRRAFGSGLRWREQSRDIRLSARLESLRSDLVFGWRQLARNKTVAGSAILSLALSIGACTSAFRLIDAMMLRPLPVADPHNLFYLTYDVVDRDGSVDRGDDMEYPLFRQQRAALKDQAELIAISYPSRMDVTYGSDHDMEKAYRQFVSGWMFGSFGLKPISGRLLTEADDVKPGQHPYAVLSHDYWTRRFGADPSAVGRTFRMDNIIYEVVGVIEEGFTGTEPGTMTDIFIPTMMNAKAIESVGWSWFRTWVRPRPNVSTERIREQLRAVFSAYRRERTTGWRAGTPKERIEEYVGAPLFLEPAAAGVSGMQLQYWKSLIILAVVVALVLFIACANVANLMTAQAAARAREMALRVSIGAGRWRLVQMVLVESALIAVIATGLGGLFAWWAAPFVVSMINPPDNPARLALPADWRVLLFAATLASTVTLLFGLAPALRASSVKPMSALKGGEDPRSRHRLMNALIAVQVAFCFVVHFGAGLFVATFDRLAHQPTGFVAERLLTLETKVLGEPAPVQWQQVADQLERLAGIESASFAGWALLSGMTWGSEIYINGQPRDDQQNPFFLSVSPAWRETMRIPLIEGRDLRPEDVHPGAALVNESFARRYFNGQSPVGKTFETTQNRKRVTTTIVGLVRDARYRNMRQPIRPTAYVPFQRLDTTGALSSQNWGTFIVRTTGADPLPLAPVLRKTVTQARSEFRVSNIRTQVEHVQQHTLRERLLAMLSLFFAAVALVLSAVGLYGVLNYSVLQRRREIGIRMALGARAADVARRVTTEVFAMLLVGALTGLIAGIASARYVETLLYQVKATDIGILATPVLTIFAAALLAALPPVIHAVRIDPAVTLRSE